MRIVNPAVARDLEQGHGLRVNLGSGPTPRAGFYSLDQAAMNGVDIVANLNEPLSLLPDDCADHVFSSHTLEHVDNLLLLLSEIHRITRPSGVIELIVPHFSNPYHYSDPTHVRFFGLYTMNYFVETDKQPHARKVPAFYTTTRFEIESVKIAFYRFNVLDRLLVPLLRYLVNRSPAAQECYELRLSRLFPAAEIRYRMHAAKPQRSR
ncbi:MAG: methyltransferase domain-containing protein [Burkholderiales bacterium]